MSANIVKVMVPPTIRAPRGAAWAAALSATLAVGLGALAALGRGASGPLQRLSRGVWSGMQASAEARARRDLLALAERRQLDSPGLAQDLREAAAFLRDEPASPPPRADLADEASAVRDQAYRLMEADPRFAAELFAAADRHERGEHGRRRH